MSENCNEMSAYYVNVFFPPLCFSLALLVCFKKKVWHFVNTATDFFFLIFKEIKKGKNAWMQVCKQFVSSCQKLDSLLSFSLDYDKTKNRW